MATSTGYGDGRGELPTKTKVVMALFAISGALSLPVGWLLVDASSSYAAVGASGMAEFSTGLGIGTVLLGGLFLALAYGLWNARSWSWYGSVLLLTAGILVNLWAIQRGGSLPVYVPVIGLVTLWALWDDQAAFGIEHGLPL
jgi:hypothetical protein